MKKILAFLRALISFATILLLVFLAWQCLDIYLSAADASSLEAIFTYEEVLQRLKGISLPALLYLLLICLTLLLQKAHPHSRPQKHKKVAHRDACAAAASGAGGRRLRLFLLIAGILLVAWGAVNGGMYDVLVKSINICTECIGLG